jgi:hypothetical protein
VSLGDIGDKIVLTDFKIATAIQYMFNGLVGWLVGWRID